MDSRERKVFLRLGPIAGTALAALAALALLGCGADSEPAGSRSEDGDAAVPASPGSAGGDPGQVVPDSWETTLGASHVGTAPVIDGRLDDPGWEAATELRFADSSGSSDNLPSVRALWDETALYLSFDVLDGALDTRPGAEVWESDGVELFLDVAGDGGSLLRSDDVHLIVTVDGRRLVQRGDGAGGAVDASIPLDEARRTRADGYAVEMRLPWSALGASVQSVREMGLLLANNDRDGGSSRQFAFVDASPWQAPSQWGRLSLEGGPAPVDDPPGTYETIVVPAGEQRVFRIGDGEVFENKLIDITAEGASALIIAFANDFVVRNIGFEGVHPGEEFPIVASVPGAGASGLIENVYLGDGSVQGSYAGAIFVHYDPVHRGTLTLRRLHIAHFSNNGVYGSAPGHRGQPGVVHVEDSYFYSNNIANIRLGTAAATSHVRNCTVLVDDSVPPCDVNCSLPGAINARGVWSWTGEVVLHDVDLRTNGHGAHLATSEGGTITMDGVRLGADADVTPPAGVPMSAEQAAQGG